MQQDDDSLRLSEKAHRQIEKMIVMRRFPPGSMISENQLSTSLGCGRTPIREALLRLKLEGFVEIHPRRGALVLPVDISKQLELLEIRRPLEMLMAELGSRRATGPERACMRELGVRVVEAAEGGASEHYFEINRAIHELRIAATHNTVLAHSMSSIFGLSRWFWYSHFSDPSSLRRASRLHQLLLEAIADGDAPRATLVTADVLEFVGQLTQNEINRRS